MSHVRIIERPPFNWESDEEFSTIFDWKTDPDYA